MAGPMEFWGVEVKVGQAVKVDRNDLLGETIHLSQIALGESKKDKANEPVVLYLKVGERKFVLGTLIRNDIPQLSVDLFLHSEFELSHNSKNSSVYFSGYKVENDFNSVSDFSDSDEDLPILNKDDGKLEKNGDDIKVVESKRPPVSIGASAKQAKIAVPKKDEADESDDDDDSDDEDDFGSSDEMDDDSDIDDDSDSDEDEDESEDDEETPLKKVDQGKKRPNGSASKNPVSIKKAKNATPENNGGKKSLHTASPHPVKKGGKNSNKKGQRS
ncbi:PREDICTED: histone deacetylase HDT1-like [Lupinus angustifolius]|uniref:histone deacetylase HDT1-like n=1 Tax=Lupinus angustifolius TaxID=3871 RepID=UPI00092F41A0|nr:PREDICTED: histone deacetylase HDT1-like [Lupinus angustifolius]